MKILLLAGQFNNLKPCQAYEFTNGKPLLTWQIENLKTFTQDIVVVLDNKNADETLRANPILMNCELAFDTNEDEASYFSNLKTGLYLVNNFCVVLPLSTPISKASIFKRLINHYHKYVSGQSVDMIQAYFPVNGKMCETFPQLITFTGKSKILQSVPFDRQALNSLIVSPLPVLREPHRVTLSNFSESTKKLEKSI